MMRFTWEWDSTSLNWIRTLPERTVPHLAMAIHDALLATAYDALLAAKMRAPIFEGWLVEDLCIDPLQRLDPLHFSIIVGESGENMVTDPHDLTGRGWGGAFSYAWAKHDGAKPHRVALYSPTGTDGPFRKKLRRWVRAHLHPDLPATEEAYRAARPDYPPWVDVDPSKSAQPFLHPLVETSWFSDKFERYLLGYIASWSSW